MFKFEGVVRGDEGSVDVDATLAKCKAELIQFCAERETEEATIADAVCAIFDEYVGVRINMPALTGFALQRLNAQPQNHKVLTERVQAYVRSNSQGKTDDDGTQERPGSLFLIGKGKGGGVARRCDLPVKA